MARKAVSFFWAAVVALSAVPAHADNLKPFVLGDTPEGDAAAVVKTIGEKLGKGGFEVAGSYSPYKAATILVFTSDELKAAAAKGTHGGYAAALRVAVTEVDGKLQVAWTNPAYLAAAYRLPDDLVAVRTKVEAVLGGKGDFGSKKGLSPEKLRKYHYMMGMEHFDDSANLLQSFPSHAEAVEAVEKGLAAGAGGVKKVYRIDIPGTEQKLFGVALTAGDGADDHVMGVVDKGELRSTPYLPYEILVDGKDVQALYMRFRCAVYFPDLTMGTFMHIMSSPKATKKALAGILETKAPAK